MLYARHWAVQIHFLTHVLHWHKHLLGLLNCTLLSCVLFHGLSLLSFSFFCSTTLSPPTFRANYSTVGYTICFRVLLFKSKCFVHIVLPLAKDQFDITEKYQIRFCVEFWNVHLVCLYKPALNQRNVGWSGGGLWKWSGRFHRRVESFVKKSATEDKRKKILVHKRCGWRTGKANL